MMFQDIMEADLRDIEEFLSSRFPEKSSMAGLFDAMNYSLLSGGKRIRPVLTLEVCKACGADGKSAMNFACGVEMIHTYSLIHDDLPCMDNDDLRRGRATNHKVYGEAMALLAVDALLTAAFEMISSAEQMNPKQIAEAVSCLSRAAGPHGMVGGQCLDIAGEGKALMLSDVEAIHKHKTGALISAAAELGCIAADADAKKRDAIHTYAEKIGLAFQIRDDMLNVEGDTEQTGKAVGSDAACQKTTFVSLNGLERCRKMVADLTWEATSALDVFEEKNSGFLAAMALQLAQRDR
jgi:geranylgeranyl diphosphate synthase type II